jgi:alpha-methylacyl-CoA racemase
MGPLAGVRIVEFASIGPGPMSCMLLAELGATVLRLDRPEPSGLGVPKPPQFDLLLRGRKRVIVDLKSENGVQRAFKLVERADAIVEGFRPGVMERLGLGPADCFARNPRLIYGRVTGWGQDGPLAKTAGHDLNYIAVAGALHAFGRRNQLPAPPLNLVGDFGAALYLALGIVSGVLEARRSGQGQIVDTAIVETAAHMLTGIYGMFAAQVWNLERGSNVLDSGAFYYDTFECADGQLISVAAIEPKFYRELLEILELDPTLAPAQSNLDVSGEGRALLARRFLTRTRDEWCRVFEGSDACVAPVLAINEAPGHPQLKARKAFVEIAGVIQPAPVPRFSRTKLDVPSPPDVGAANPDRALDDWLDVDEIAEWKGPGTGVSTVERAYRRM